MALKTYQISIDDSVHRYIKAVAGILGCKISTIVERAMMPMEGVYTVKAGLMAPWLRGDMTLDERIEALKNITIPINLTPKPEDCDEGIQVTHDPIDSDAFSDGFGCDCGVTNAIDRQV